MKHPSILTYPVLALTSLLSLVAKSDAQLVTNGLMIDLDATSWSGTGAWTNAGSLGGTFTPDGTPTKTKAAGVNGVFLDGTDAFAGPASVAGIDGTGDRTVEVWAYQGAVSNEETLIAWGKRGGPDGTNQSLNWGSNAVFGALGAWGGGPDQGYGAGQPSKGSWHHIAFTLNAAGDKSIYVDGVLATQETGAANGPVLNTSPGLGILIGAQQAAGAIPGTNAIDGGNKLSGVIGKIRVNNGVLSAADITNNYNFEKNLFQLTTPATSALTAAPNHRWSFNESSGTSFSNTGTAGSLANAAILKGAGAALTGTGVDLPGGSSATAAYIDLPNGVASGKDLSPGGYSSVTYEGWVTSSSTQAWSRLFDFGTNNNAAGEVTDVGGSFNGTDYVFLSNNTGGDLNMQMERAGAAAVQPGNRSAPGNTILGSQQHFVMTYDATDGHWKWYQNGKLIDGFASTAPSTLTDINNWLGRSNWAGDANTDGTYDEFRIYGYALSEAQVQQNLLDGPNRLTIVPEPSAGLMALAGLGLWARRRHRS